MSGLILPQLRVLRKPYRPWRWKPNALEEPFRSIAKRAAFIFAIWEGGGGAVDLVTGTVMPIETGASWTTGSLGIGSITSSTTLGHFNLAGYTPLVTSSGDGLGDFSMLAFGAPVSESRYACLLEQGDNSPLRSASLYANTNSAFGVSAGSFAFITYAAGAASGVSATSQVDGVEHCWVGVRSGTILTLDRDRVQQAVTDLAARDILGGSQAFRIGNAADTSGDFACKQPIWFTAGWNSALSPAERAIVGADPFGLIRPVRRSWIGYTASTGVLFDAAFSSGDIAAADSFSFAVPWSGTNRGLDIKVPMLGPGVTVTAMTYGGANCTYIDKIASVTSFGSIEFWRIVQADSGAPAAGSNTLAGTLSGSLEFAVIGKSLTGVHQTVPTEAFNSAQATNGAGAADASVAITSIADNCLITAGVVASDTSITANQTSRTNVSGTLGSGADEDCGIKTPAGAVTASYTDVGAFATWAIGGYAWRPVAASGSVDVLLGQGCM